MAVLVTGGAGYIGSVTVELLRKQGEGVVVLDNLSRGHRGAVGNEVPFYEGKVGDRDLVQRIIRESEIESCIHFAALANVSESVAEPERYLENNVEQGRALIDTLANEGVKHVVFSSSCATYGEPEQVPIAEDHPQRPTNPYGSSKLATEQALDSYDRTHGLRFIALRYFNAAGASAEHGEHHEPETHLIPNVLAAALGQLPFVSVFGDDYATPDGTAIRDYIHVLDLGAAHIAALEYLRAKGESTAINLGTGRGYSVLEVIESARRITGRKIEIRREPRRAGDPSHLVAANQKAREVLNWQTSYSDLETIIRTAFDWQLSHPGYGRQC